VSGNSKLRSWIIAAVMVADLALIVGLRLHVSVSDLYKPLGFAVLLSALWVVYWHRKEPKFILVLMVLNHLVLFGWGYMVLLYSGATLNRPLIDDVLVHWDGLLGYRWVVGLTPLGLRC
jgi:hypothetical protein